jgi:hypothetical protein
VKLSTRVQPFGAPEALDTSLLKFAKSPVVAIRSSLMPYSIYQSRRQILTSVPSPPETKYCTFRLTAIDHTKSPWPVIVDSNVPPATSHILMVLSKLPETKIGHPR